MHSTEQVIEVPPCDYHGSFQEFLLTITRLDSFDGEGANEYIEFNPPLEVRGYIDNDEILSFHYDFGMRDEINRKRMGVYGDNNPETPWTEKIKNTVRFDLEHAFFHTSIDPNYVSIHYALFGCLCLRGRTKLFRTGQEPIILQWIP